MGILFDFKQFLKEKLKKEKRNIYIVYSYIILWSQQYK